MRLRQSWTKNTCKAVNIYPGKIDSVLSGLAGISCEYQVMLDRLEGKDRLLLKVELAQDADVSSSDSLGKKVKDLIRRKILVTPEVQKVPCGSLPRSERKTIRVIDNRGQ